MEIDRVRFMMTSYLRTRLLKIQKYALHITGSAEFYNRLSNAEFEFAKKYVDVTQRHYTSVLDQLPEKLQAFETDMIKEPDLNTYVFCLVNTDLGEVEVNAGSGSTQDEQVVDLQQNDIYALRYSSIRQFLGDGTVDLI